MKIKKLFALLSVYVLTATAAIGYSKVANSDVKTEQKTEAGIVGEWKMKPIGDSGISMSLDIKYVFNKDGSGYIEALGEKVDISYSINGDQLTLTMADVNDVEQTETGLFKLKGDTLTLIDGEDTVEFERVK